MQHPWSWLAKTRQHKFRTAVEYTFLIVISVHSKYLEVLPMATTTIKRTIKEWVI